MAGITLMSYSSYHSQLKWKNSPDLLLDRISENGIYINNSNLSTVKLHFIFIPQTQISKASRIQKYHGKFVFIVMLDNIYWVKSHTCCNGTMGT